MEKEKSGICSYKPVGFKLVVRIIKDKENLCMREKKRLTSVSRSEEEMPEELGEAVSKVLNETEPEKSRFLTNPILAFNG